MQQRVVQTKGVLACVHHDERTIFLSSKKEVDAIEAQPAGEHPQT